jgi:4-hydroxybenzoyl-CoA reductase alpha subunit
VHGVYKDHGSNSTGIRKIKEENLETLSVVGKRLPRIDAVEKAKGVAKYTSDIVFSGMLFGKILRSPFPHAKIMKIDVSKAERVPGVKAVITAKDTPGIKYLMVGPQFQDKDVLAVDRVRYVGDEVAAVAAETLESLEEALDLIDVTYESLPTVFDPEDAMREDAPRIHDAENNVAMRIERNYGDVEKAFRESDHVFENRFVTQAVAHCCMECHGTVASFDVKGNLTVWTPTQSPYFVQKELGIVLDMPVSKIRIREVPVGGGFGSRAKICTDEAVCALLSKKTGRPVKISLTREEEFAATCIRHPSIITLKTGVKKDGTLLGRHIKLIMDNGAYNHQGPAVMGYASQAASSLYSVPCVKVESELIYTNKQYGGPFRGYGNPQVTFAIESQMDMIADRLGIDRLDLRLKNCNPPGDVTACGWRITSSGFKECLQKVAQEIGWEGRKETLPKNRGVGLSGLIHVAGAKIFADGDFSAAYIKMLEDGSIRIYTGTTDIGQGSSTSLSMIAAEILGISLEDVQIMTMDTDLTPADLGTWASRILFIGGNAIRMAAEDLRRQLLEAGAKELECSPSDLQLMDKRISIIGRPEKSISVGEAVFASPNKMGKVLIGKGHYDPPSEITNRETGVANIAAAYSFGAQAIEVEVDEDTGKVRIVRVVAAYDIGKAINPDIVEGQIEGGILQGIGYALSEKLKYDSMGQLENPNFLDYKILFSEDTPKIDVFLIETDDPEGPFGAKSVGEPSLIPTAAAIANAIHDALGTRINELPIIQENICRHMEKGVC